MAKNRSVVLSIAGFDPSGCAGLLADCKTFEANEVYGITVCTANTLQNDVEFSAPNWIPVEQILQQYELLKKRFQFEYVKIGIVQNFQVLSQIISTVKESNEAVKIIWDPVLKASSGFELHSGINKDQLVELCKKIYLITPNLEEISAMLPKKSPEESGKVLSKYCNVLVKGGHGTGEYSMDVLYTSDKVFRFSGPRLQLSKRGTGCVLSAAITANLARGRILPEACMISKNYVTAYIRSSDTLIGYHNT